MGDRLERGALTWSIGGKKIGYATRIFINPWKSRQRRKRGHSCWSATKGEIKLKDWNWRRRMIVKIACMILCSPWFLERWCLKQRKGVVEKG